MEMSESRSFQTCREQMFHQMSLVIQVWNEGGAAFKWGKGGWTRGSNEESFIYFPNFKCIKVFIAYT